MILLYSGTPGSGKSLHVAERLYHLLRAGRPVICNFNINLNRIPPKRRDYSGIPCAVLPELLSR